MTKSILAYIGRWAIVCLLAVPFLALLCIVGSDMPMLTYQQAFIARGLAVIAMVGLVAAGYLCATKGLLPDVDEEDINDPDEED